MSLAVKFPAANDVPEALREFFKPSGDGTDTVILDLAETPLGFAPSAKLDEFRETNRRLMTEAKRFEGIDPAKARADSAELAELIKTGVKPGEDILETPRVKAHVARLTEEGKNKDLAIEELKGQIKEGENKLLTRVRDDEARKIGIDLGVRPTAMDDFVRRVRDTFGFDDKGNLVAKGADGTPLLGKEGKALPMQEFGEGLRESAPHLFSPSSGGGASANGARGAGATKAIPRNADGSVNLTALQELKSTDPTFYKQIIDNGDHLKPVEKKAA